MKISLALSPTVGPDSDPALVALLSKCKRRHCGLKLLSLRSIDVILLDGVAEASGSGGYYGRLLLQAGSREEAECR